MDKNLENAQNADTNAKNESQRTLMILELLPKGNCWMSLAEFQAALKETPDTRVLAKKLRCTEASVMEALVKVALQAKPESFSLPNTEEDLGPEDFEHFPPSEAAGGTAAATSGKLGAVGAKNDKKLTSAEEQFLRELIKDPVSKIAKNRKVTAGSLFPVQGRLAEKLGVPESERGGRGLREKIIPLAKQYFERQKPSTAEPSRRG